MASSAAMPEPIRVSPLIRVGRWTFLGMGILWGISRHRSLTKKETKLREIAEMERPAKEAAQAKEKARLNREEMIYLANATGTPIPPNF